MKQTTSFFKFFLFLFFASNMLILSAQTTWIGGVGDWHDPDNWDTGQIPTSNDVVIIDQGEVHVLSGNSAFALFLKTSADLLMVESNAELVVEKGYKGLGIHNKGILNVEGRLYVLSIADMQAIGILNEGEINNQGLIKCKDITDGYGITNYNRISNEEEINISKCGVWCIDNKGSIANEGLINIYNTSQHGILCSGTSIIDNLGELNIDCPSQGIFNYGIFNNTSGAIVRIEHPAGQGLTCFLLGHSANSSTAGSVDNRGLIYVDGGQTNIYASAGNFNNRGKIFAINSTSTGIKVSSNGTLKNYSQIQIYDGTGNGITCSGFYVNRRRGNTAMWNLDQTHIEINSQGELRNFGYMSMDDSGQKNIDNSGVFTNYGFGNLGLRNEVLTHTGSNFTNYGHISNDYNGNNTIATTTFVNNAVLGDKTSSFSNIINNGIHVLPIGPNVFVGQPTFNALELGSLNGMTVGNWGTILNWQSMGTYNASNNSFTPNANALGVTEFVVEITINSVNRTAYYRVPVVGGVQSAPNPIQTSTFSYQNQIQEFMHESEQNPAKTKKEVTLDIQIFPNPVQENLIIKLPKYLEAESLTYEILTSNGHLVSREEIKDLASLTIPVTELPSGLYVLSITKGEDVYLKRFIKQ